MNNDIFFPNRIIYFLLILLSAMVIDCPLVFLLKDVDAEIKQTIFFMIFCITFLLLVGYINIRKKNKICFYYTKRLDSLWISVLMVVVIHFLFSQPLITILDGKSTNEMNSLPIIVGSLILAPVLEETMFRGVLLRGLLTRYSPIFSIILSSALFALIHVHISQIILAFFLGILFGLIFLKTHSLLYTILLHFCANVTTWFSTFLYMNKIYQTLNLSLLLVIVVFALVLYCFGILRLNKLLSRNDL